MHHSTNNLQFVFPLVFRYIKGNDWVRRSVGLFHFQQMRYLRGQSLTFNPQDPRYLHERGYRALEPTKVDPKGSSFVTQSGNRMKSAALLRKQYQIMRADKSKGVLTIHNAGPMPEDNQTRQWNHTEVWLRDLIPDAMPLTQKAVGLIKKRYYDFDFATMDALWEFRSKYEFTVLVQVEKGGSWNGSCNCGDFSIRHYCASTDMQLMRKDSQYMPTLAKPLKTACGGNGGAGAIRKAVGVDIRHRAASAAAAAAIPSSPQQSPPKAQAKSASKKKRPDEEEAVVEPWLRKGAQACDFSECVSCSKAYERAPPPGARGGSRSHTDDDGRDRPTQCHTCTGRIHDSMCGFLFSEASSTTAARHVCKGCYTRLGSLFQPISNHTTAQNIAEAMDKAAREKVGAGSTATGKRAKKDA